MFQSAFIYYFSNMFGLDLDCNILWFLPSHNNNTNRTTFRYMIYQWCSSSIYLSFDPLPTISQSPFPTYVSFSYSTDRCSLSCSLSTYHLRVIARSPPASYPLPLAAWRSLRANWYLCTRRKIATWVVSAIHESGDVGRRSV